MCKKKRRQIVNGREGTHKIEGQQSQKFIISKDPWNLQTDSETDQLGESENSIKHITNTADKNTKTIRKVRLIQSVTFENINEKIRKTN